MLSGVPQRPPRPPPAPPSDPIKCTQTPLVCSGEARAPKQGRPGRRSAFGAQQQPARWTDTQVWSWGPPRPTPSQEKCCGVASPTGHVTRTAGRASNQTKRKRAARVRGQAYKLLSRPGPAPDAAGLAAGPNTTLVRSHLRRARRARSHKLNPHSAVQDRPWFAARPGPHE